MTIVDSSCQTAWLLRDGLIAVAAKADRAVRRNDLCRVLCRYPHYTGAAAVMDSETRVRNLPSLCGCAPACRSSRISLFCLLLSALSLCGARAACGHVAYGENVRPNCTLTSVVQMMRRKYRSTGMVDSSAEKVQDMPQRLWFMSRYRRKAPARCLGLFCKRA